MIRSQSASAFSQPSVTGLCVQRPALLTSRSSPPPTPDRCRNHALDVPAPGDVGHERLRAPAALLDARCYVQHGLLHVAEGDCGALLRQHLGEAGAQPLRCSGDDRRLSLQKPAHAVASA